MVGGGDGGREEEVLLPGEHHEFVGEIGQPVHLAGVGIAEAFAVEGEGERSGQARGVAEAPPELEHAAQFVFGFLHAAQHPEGIAPRGVQGDRGRQTELVGQLLLPVEVIQRQAGIGFLQGPLELPPGVERFEKLAHQRAHRRVARSSRHSSGPIP